MVSRDEFRERQMQERLISVHAALAGIKGSDGKPAQIVDVEAELVKFDERLRRPLNYERVREAVLKEVASS